MNDSQQLILKQMEIGPMENFQYFIGDNNSGEVAIVDPAWDVDFIRAQAKKNNYKISYIFLTHGHMDHVNGVDDLLSTHDVPVYISQHESDMYTPHCKNLNKVPNGAKLKIGEIEIDCIHTPGHTPGGQCFKYNNSLIAGDTLFIDGCGRCDLPGGDAKVMYNSIYEVLMKLPDSTVIYPGHNYGPTPDATLGDQKKTNPYLTCNSMDEFFKQRMGLVF